MIYLIILCIFALLTALSFIVGDEKGVWGAIGYASFWVALFFALLFGYSRGIKEGQIEMLKGNQKYEMNIRYEKIDGEFVPVDTLFIKID